MSCLVFIWSWGKKYQNKTRVQKLYTITYDIFFHEPINNDQQDDLEDFTHWQTLYLTDVMRHEYIVLIK